VRTKPKWSLQDAKAQFSEVVRRTIANGPQVVTKNGADAVVIVAASEFSKLQKAGGASVAQLLADSPLGSVTLDVDRPRSSGRRVKL
jgi:prevent-host-death family protein